MSSHGDTETRGCADAGSANLPYPFVSFVTFCSKTQAERRRRLTPSMARLGLRSASEALIRFAGAALAGYGAVMSSAVLELKEKVERLTSEERYELMQILEDIEDNALADKAEAEGGWTKLADLKKELGRA